MEKVDESSMTGKVLVRGTQTVKEGKFESDRLFLTSRKVGSEHATATFRFAIIILRGAFAIMNYIIV